MACCMPVVFFILTGPKITDPGVLKREALDLIRGWPSDLLAVMGGMPESAVVRMPLVDRWLWPSWRRGHPRAAAWLWPATRGTP
jgi:hypothetical protein